MGENPLVDPCMLSTDIEFIGIIVPVTPVQIFKVVGCQIIKLTLKLLQLYNSRSQKQVNSHVNSNKISKLSILLVVYKFTILDLFDLIM
jgi:hypothetical protein